MKNKFILVSYAAISMIGFIISVSKFSALGMLGFGFAFWVIVSERWNLIR